MQESVSKVLSLDDLSGAVSAYYQSNSEPIVLDTKNVEITNPKTAKAHEMLQELLD